VLRLTSLAIFAGALEVEIEHKGAVYRLRQTSLGKLILTK
jgi:hemin uptake protein HemP